MDFVLFGPPQIAALLILLQRGLEELYSQRNTARLIEAGAREVGRAYYPVVATTHLAWIAAIYALIPPYAPVSPALIGLYLILQIARYWVIATLGKYWTHRIITIEGAPIVRHGPYRYVKHPNYVVSVVETFLLPLAFGEAALGAIMTAIWFAVLRYKILLEDEALGRRERP
jgi:methyltransferase